MGAQMVRQRTTSFPQWRPVRLKHNQVSQALGSPCVQSSPRAGLSLGLPWCAPQSLTTVAKWSLSLRQNWLGSECQILDQRWSLEGSWMYTGNTAAHPTPGATPWCRQGQSASTNRKLWTGQDWLHDCCHLSRHQYGKLAQYRPFIGTAPVAQTQLHTQQGSRLAQAGQGLRDSQGWLVLLQLIIPGVQLLSTVGAWSSETRSHAPESRLWLITFIGLALKSDNSLLSLFVGLLAEQFLVQVDGLIHQALEWLNFHHGVLSRLLSAITLFPPKCLVCFFVLLLALLCELLASFAACSVMSVCSCSCTTSSWESCAWLVITLPPSRSSCHCCWNYHLQFLLS